MLRIERETWQILVDKVNRARQELDGKDDAASEGGAPSPETDRPAPASPYRVEKPAPGG